MIATATLYIKTPLQNTFSIQYKEDQLPIPGGQKDVYFSTDKQYALAFYRDTDTGQRLNRLLKIITRYSSQPLAASTDDKSLIPGFAWPLAIILTPKLGVVTATYPPEFSVRNARTGQQVLAKSSWFSSQSASQIIHPDDKGDLRTALLCCADLCRSLRWLHQGGMAHSDLSSNNVLFNMRNGRALITDLDSLVVPELYPPEVFGTQGYIPPECISAMRAKHKLTGIHSRNADLHALAVLAYELLFKRHPLLGSTNRFFTLPIEEQEYQEFGPGALFIEHPSDSSNRLDNLTIPLETSGPQLTALFRRAFVAGLHEPQKRPGAVEWEHAFTRALDLLVPCANPQCPHKWFIFRGQASRQAFICPYCKTQNAPAPVLKFFSTNGRGYQGTLVLHHSEAHKSSKHIFLRHLGISEPRTENSPLAYSTADRKGHLLVNLSTKPLKVDGISLPSNKAVYLRSGQLINFTPHTNDGIIAQVHYG